MIVINICMIYNFSNYNFLNLYLNMLSLQISYVWKSNLETHDSCITMLKYCDKNDNIRW